MGRFIFYDRNSCRLIGIYGDRRIVHGDCQDFIFCLFVFIDSRIFYWEKAFKKTGHIIKGRCFMKTNYLKTVMTAAVVLLLTAAFSFASEMDDRIESSAKDSYVFKTYLKDDSIMLSSSDGVVTLTGTVGQEIHKSLAQETAENLPGVKRVDNQLALKTDSPDKNSDAWISMQVKYSLLYNRNVSGMNTQVFVSDGVVTLRGEAKNQAQKDLAGEYAKDVNGVKGVNNEMTVATMSKSIYSGREPVSQQTIGEAIDDASVTALVKASLLFHRSTSMFKTGVSTDDGVVTLSGAAASAAAKDMAGKVASDVKGVTRVINNMAVNKSVSKK